MNLIWPLDPHFFRQYWCYVQLSSYKDDYGCCRQAQLAAAIQYTCSLCGGKSQDIFPSHQIATQVCMHMHIFTWYCSSTRTCATSYGQRAIHSGPCSLLCVPAAVLALLSAGPWCAVRQAASDCRSFVMQVLHRHGQKSKME